MMLTTSVGSRAAWLSRVCGAWLVMAMMVLNGCCGCGATAADATPTSALAAESAASRVKVTTIEFDSVALGGPAKYVVYAPAEIDPAQKLPVLYLLHGYGGGNEPGKDWNAPKVDLIGKLAGRPMLVVLPDGKNSWYLDSPKVPASKYETFLTQDLIKDVESRFPVATGREGRGIAGLSMGGHGAMTLAARHPELFSSASSMSGILKINSASRLKKRPDAWGLATLLGPHAENKQLWAEHTATELAPKFVDADVALLFDTGDKDETGCLDDNRRFHEKLTNRIVKHEYREFAGGRHNWDYWTARLPEHLKFHEDNFARRASGGAGSKAKRELDKWAKLYMDRALKFEEECAALDNGTTASTVVMIGSSSLQLAERQKLFPEYVIAWRGISADQMGRGERGLLHRLYSGAIDCKPRAIVILNGNNDVGSIPRTGKPKIEEVSAVLKEMLVRLKAAVPEAKVFVAANFPTGGEKYSAMAPYVAKLNEDYKRVAEAEGVIYVDTFSPLADTDGKVKKEYMADGLHLNKDGMKVFEKVLGEALRANGILPDRVGAQVAK